ncbi:hypothetical protein ACFQS1_34695 [Paractinoplanes rhizophilus]|uniref:Secreted protein n=1 Tax=Paractinoplanes rhizophilus TaxID=1416877 RepID=A0ABW2I2Q8_9ACTN|nr:hypothetical protein [Actinoplanes sp.]
MSRWVKSALAGSVLAATAALVPALPAAAAPTVPCFKGYICVQEAKGVITAVPEGQSYAFPAGTEMAGISNQTAISYCVGGNPNFQVTAGQEVVRSQPITGFQPGRFCLT